MIEVGQFAICGDWDNSPTPEGKLRIIMPPLGHVSGAGWQGVTQVALLELPKHITLGCSFAEIGAGSGILSVAAKLLGAGMCYATEINPEMLSVARRVLAANNVDVRLIEGTFVDVPVDVAVISISSKFAEANRDQVRAAKILVVHDNATVEVLE